MIEILFTIFHVLICVLLVVTVLLQAGKGGGLAGSIGGGLASSSVLGGPYRSHVSDQGHDRFGHDLYA